MPGHAGSSTRRATPALAIRPISSIRQSRGSSGGSQSFLRRSNMRRSPEGSMRSPGSRPTSRLISTSSTGTAPSSRRSPHCETPDSGWWMRRGSSCRTRSGAVGSGSRGECDARGGETPLEALLLFLRFLPGLRFPCLALPAADFPGLRLPGPHPPAVDHVHDEESEDAQERGDEPVLRDNRRLDRNRRGPLVVRSDLRIWLAARAHEGLDRLVPLARHGGRQPHPYRLAP